MQRYYTVSELPELGKLARPAILAVIGNPIAHSFSPQMQQAALDAMGVEGNYIRVEAGLAPGEFEHCVRLLAQLGFRGVNVTIPFKKRAAAMADEADELSQICGASNTLIFTPQGSRAHNTDGPGFERAVQELCGQPLSELRTLILGACGGAGSALAAQCALSGCPQLSLANRPKPELALLTDTLRRQARPGCSIRSLSMADTTALAAAVAEADLIVNATSLGLKEGDPLPLDPACLRPEQIVCDIVPHDTALRRAATARGCRAADGLGMLLWQGACACELWFGALPPVENMRRALSAAAAGC